MKAGGSLWDGEAEHDSITSLHPIFAVPERGEQLGEHQVGPRAGGKLGMQPMGWMSRVHGHIPPRHLAEGLSLNRAPGPWERMCGGLRWCCSGPLMSISAAGGPGNLQW